MMKLITDPPQQTTDLGLISKNRCIQYPGSRARSAGLAECTDCFPAEV